MGTAKYVTIACLAVAGAPVAADDHAPTSLRMRAPSPGAPEPTGLPLRRVAAAPDPAPAADAAPIERVEVLKDGASAIYGADAVRGVVNLITRPQFDCADVS